MAQPYMIDPETGKPFDPSIPTKMGLAYNNRVVPFNTGKNITEALGDLWDASKLAGLTPELAPIGGAPNIPVAAKMAKQATSQGSKATAREIAKQIEQGTGVFGKLTPDMKMYALPPEKYRGKTLKGMPDIVTVDGKKEQFGTDQRIVDIAKQYMSDKGLVYVPQPEYAAVDVKRAEKIAKAYEKMINNPADPKVKKSYDALVKETQDQYETLRKAGYKFEFYPDPKNDPYGNPRNAINDIILNKHLYVYPTESGFGSINKSLEANPFLQKTGETWNGKPVTVNDLFRGIHDVFGHAKHGVGFRAGGEENAWQSHARMFSPEAVPAATSETRGQNSWLNFGPYGQKNRIADTTSTTFADQKTGILPDWTWIEGLLK